MRACRIRCVCELRQERAMGYDRAQFLLPDSVPAVDGYECAICHDVVCDAASCQQGHRRATWLCCRMRAARVRACCIYPAALPADAR
jgi:hypothetical protein